jgi:hypothetical protein
VRIMHRVSVAPLRSFTAKVVLARKADDDGADAYPYPSTTRLTRDCSMMEHGTRAIIRTVCEKMSPICRNH